MLPRFWMAGSRRTRTPWAASASRPAAQVDGHDRRQQLGRQAHGQGEGEEERLQERPVQRDVGGEDAHHEQQDDADDEQTEAAHTALEVILRCTFGQPARDEAIRGPRAGGHDDRAAGPAHDARAEEHQGGPPRRCPPRRGSEAPSWRLEPTLRSWPRRRRDGWSRRGRRRPARHRRPRHDREVTPDRPHERDLVVLTVRMTVARSASRARSASDRDR